MLLLLFLVPDPTCLFASTCQSFLPSEETSPVIIGVPLAQKQAMGIEEMVQPFRTVIDVAEDQGSIPATYTAGHKHL